MSIDERDYPLYESVILSEQMPAHQVLRFLDDNLEFKSWYLKRRQDSAAGVGTAPLPRTPRTGG